MKGSTYILAVAVLVIQYATADITIKILHFNDFHARIEADDEYHLPCDGYRSGKGLCSGGLARAKAFIDEERSKGEPMLVLNAGDDFIGTHWNHVYKGDATANFMNWLGIDAMTLGNHEFDYGPDVLLRYVQQLKYPVLSANMQANGHALGHYVKRYTTKHIGGFKVGICGVTTRGTGSYSNSSPVYFDDLFQAAKNCVHDVRHKEGAKIVILLSHEGYNADRYLAKLIPDVDIVVGGHSHSFLWNWNWGAPPALTHHGHTITETVRGDYPTMEWSKVQSGRRVPVVQAGWGGKYIGRAYLTFDDEGELKGFDGQPVFLGGSESGNTIYPDHVMESHIRSWKHW